MRLSVGRPQFTNQAERIIVAIDFDDFVTAKPIIDELEGTGVMVKFGNQIGTYEGWSKLVRYAHSKGLKVFCDTKFKDIPHTVEKSCRAISRFSPEIFNVMADNTTAALKGAVAGADSAVADFGAEKPLVIGVTVLTSISEGESGDIYGGGAAEKVLQFAQASAENGLDGLVCSAQEAGMLRDNPKTANLILITPGIRPEWASKGDQSRVMTPAQAVQSGADYLVIGRPITQPPESVGNSKDALELIIKELENNNG